MQLVDASGLPMSTTPIESNDGVTAVSVLPETVTLNSDTSASFVLQYSDVPAGSETCSRAKWLAIYLPGTGFVGGPSPVTATTTIAPCGGIVYISPIRASTSPP